MTGYSTREVAEIVGLSPRQVRAYARSGVVSPERGPGNAYRFGFQDVVVLRTARELRDARVAPRTIRAALGSLREQLPRGRPLTAVAISAEGERVVVRDRDTVWEPDTGQVHFDFQVSELAAEVAPLARRQAEERIARGQLSADEWFDLAFDLEAVALGRAKDAYRRAIELDPGHADAHLNLGRLLHEGGEPEEAESHYRQALAADPSSAMAAYNLAVLLEDREKPDQARDAYERAVRLDPDLADAHYNLALLLERTGEREAALRHLAEYKRLNRSAQ